MGQLRTFLLAVALLLVTIPAGSAVAAPYPPPACGTLEVSTTTPLAGGMVVVSGTSWAPNVTVRIVLSGQAVPPEGVPTDAQGRFSTTITIPAAMSGQQVLTAEGDGACGKNRIVLTVGRATAAGSSGTGGLPFTGADVLQLLLVAAGLILVGSVLLLRRRPPSPDTRRHHFCRTSR